LIKVEKRRGHLAPSLLTVCAGVTSIHWSPLISIGKIPGSMEDQLSSLGHQRKFNFVYRVGHLMVVVVNPIEEKDHWDIELSKIVMV
jgi:hypothetical protein